MDQDDLGKLRAMRELREQLAKQCSEKGYDLEEVFFSDVDYFKAPLPENLSSFWNGANFVKKHGEEATRAWLDDAAKIGYFKARNIDNHDL
jgi:hypothetical protein